MAALHKGYFEQADGSTLFLDEIGDLLLDQQAKRLRVLEDSAVTRGGSTTPVKIDFRLAAAASRNLRSPSRTVRFAPTSTAGSR